LNDIDKVLIPTRLMEEILTAHGLEPSRGHFLRYGIDLPTTPLPAPARRPETADLAVGFIGSLQETKGVHGLLPALALLPEEPLNVQIYGRIESAPYGEMLQRLAGHDPRVAFKGIFPNAEVIARLRSLDVLVVPSIWHENAPLVVYSAQAASCPVLASNLRGLSEVVEDGVNGLLFPAGDAAALAGCLQRLSRD